MVTIVLPIIQVREWPLASINSTALVLNMKQNVFLVEGISHNKPALFSANIIRAGSIFPCLNTEPCIFFEANFEQLLGCLSNLNYFIYDPLPCYMH